MHTPILSAVEKAAQEGLLEAARVGLADARALAPKDDLDLVKSGAARVEDLTSQISFTAEHSIVQHENLQYEHPNGGQAKFLETAVMALDVGGIVADRVRARLGGHG